MPGGRPETADRGITDPVWARITRAGLFGTESRQHMLDAGYLSRWFPKRGAERLRYLTHIGKTSPFWLGTPAPSA
jgi:hypothetical protein